MRRKVGHRPVNLPGIGASSADLHIFDDMPLGQSFDGPAVIESAFTTVVVDRGRFQRTQSRNLVIDLAEEVR
jgi:hypothetical protein